MGKAIGFVVLGAIFGYFVSNSMVAIVAGMLLGMVVYLVLEIS